MEELITFIESVLPAGITLDMAWKILLVLCLGTLAFSLFGRMIGGKRSDFNRAVCSAIGILFIYVLTVIVISGSLSDFDFFINPLPFVTISGGYLTLFNFHGASFPVICDQVLNTVILAFLVNLLDSFMPKGKHILSWYLFRCLTIVLSMAALTLVNWLIATYAPVALSAYAPMILLGILVFMLLLGVMKLLLGVVLAAVNPVIAAVYAFFFSHRIGKMISKAVLTTLILCVLVYALGQIGLTSIAISANALISYIPMVIALIIIWYVVGHVL